MWMGTLIGLVYRLYSATWSYQVRFTSGSRAVNLKTKHPERAVVVGHWHGDELALIGYGRQSKLLTLSSQSKDGAIMAAALNVLGVTVVRGSSSRGGMRGLVSMIRMLRKETFIISFAVDGPTGPRHRAKTGVYLFAFKTGLPLYQCMVRCDRKWTLHKIWNKTYLPKPFAQTDRRQQRRNLRHFQLAVILCGMTPLPTTGAACINAGRRVCQWDMGHRRAINSHPELLLK
ncbi:hypothetical protein DSCA_42040 [Desulfosarcina alkanivorans]|uniref:DUF374 domain-containing protein n=2 Tax=Desulfosarcina alkanivorans TaxID=571177 RepID=A0A5K7YVE3_9BACT|nr:hypothetical protein DSCA_42040 [Desulfosarcina alkanivorans]